MSKRKKVFTTITIVFLIFSILFCIFLYENDLFSYMYYRHYNGDRITINLSVTIDGEFITSDNVKAYMASDEDSKQNGNNISVKDKDDYVTFSIRANEYGDYHINVNICDYSFMLNAYQWNWWDVQNINLYIGIDTKKNEYTTHEEYSHISEECNVVEDSEPEATYEIGGMNHISIGCKG